MIYEECAPAGQAASVSSAYWRFSLDDHDEESFEHVIMPDGAISLSVAATRTDASPLICTGAARVAHRVVVQKGTVYAGVRIRPGAAAALLPETGQAYAYKLTPLIDPGRLAPLHDALIQFARMHEQGAMDAAVPTLAVPDRIDEPMIRATAMMDAAHGSCRIAGIADQLGLSSRQFRRRFVEHVGLTPKDYAMVRRLRAAYVQAIIDKDAEWASVAQQAGYADQAHLCRESRKVFQGSPRAVEAYLAAIDHDLLHQEHGRFLQEPHL